MAQADPPIAAPKDLSAAWIETDIYGVGKARLSWVTVQGGANLSYARQDVYLRSKELPSYHYHLATLTGLATTADIVPRNGWTGRIYVEWEVQIRASASGKTAESPWVPLAALKTPTPTITSVVRTSVDRATAHFAVPGGGIAAPTSVLGSKAREGQSAGASASVNNVVMPATSLGIPLGSNAGTYRYDLRLNFHGPAGFSGWSNPRTVEAWWQPVPAASGLTATRLPNGQIQLGWSVGESTSRNPVRSQIVRRKPVTGGDFATVATLGVAARSWTDTSTTILSEWIYEVVTVGDLGWAQSRPSVTVRVGMSPPDAPTGITVERDAQHPNTLRVGYSPRTSSEKPTTDVRLLVRDVDGTESVAVGWTKDSSAFGLLVHAAGPNRLVRYAVEARNAAGSSELSAWSDEWATTPKGATRLTAQRTGANVSLTWVAAGDTIATGWEIERSGDGGLNRFPLPPVAGGATRSAVHVSAAYNVEHEYWIRPTRPGAPDADWLRASGIVGIGAAPRHPLIEEPGWGAIGEPVDIAWQHQSVDGTQQREAEITWYIEDTDTWGSLPIIGDIQTATLPVSTDHTLSYWVRTLGTGSNTWSQLEFAHRQFAARPAMTLSVPSVENSPQLRGSLSIPGAWISATVDLLNSSGDTVQSLLLTPDVGTDFTFPVEDRQTYTVSAWAHNGRLASVVQEVTVTVAWARPSRADLTAVVVDETVRLDVDAPFGLRVNALSYVPDLDAYAELAFTSVVMDRVRQQAWEIVSFPWTFARPIPDGGWPTVINPTPARTWIRVFNPASSARGFSVKSGGTLVNELLLQPGESVWAHSALSGSVTIDAHSDMSALPDGLCVVGLRTLIFSGEEEIIGSALPGDAIPGEMTPGSHGRPPLFSGGTPNGEYMHGSLPTPAGSLAWRAVEAESEGESSPDLPGPVRVELIRITDGIEHILGDAVERVGWDLWPRFCAPEVYVARAWATNGAWSDSAPVEATVHQRDTVINFGPDLSGRVTHGPREPSISGGLLPKESVQWEGWRFPDHYEGLTPSPEAVDVSARLWEDHSSLDEWRRAHNAGGLVLWRDSSGMVIYGTLLLGDRRPQHRLHREISYRVEEGGLRP